jgi:hypothetical protein
MPYRDYEDDQIEPLIDGMISLIQKNLIARTSLISDAHIGDTSIKVSNALRFARNDWIILMDNTSVFSIEENRFENYEFHQIEWVTQSDTIYLKDAIQKDFLLSGNAKILRSIHKSILYEKDVLYGDRSVIPADHVAICIEPSDTGNSWTALRMLTNEHTVSILVYVKSAGQGPSEELAQRICNAYAAALKTLFMGNIHTDLVMDEVQLKYDAHVGDMSIKLPKNAENFWPVDGCPRYDVQDNNNAETCFPLVGAPETSSSSGSSSVSSVSESSSSTDSESSSSKSSSSVSSSSTSQLETSSQSSSTADESTSTSSVKPSWEQSSTSTSSVVESHSSLSSASSQSSPSTDSSSTFSTESSSVSSWSSSSQSQSSESSTYSSKSSQSVDYSSASTSSDIDYYEVFVQTPLLHDYLVVDKAVLRRKIRYMYDSMITSTEYGTTQKGSAMLKAARLTWNGKETKTYDFPQVGKGGYIYE